MTGPSAEELRRRLYRRGAGPADVEAYWATGSIAPEPADGAPHPAGRPVPRRAAVLVVPLASIVGGVAATALLRGPATAPAPTPPPTLPMLQIALGVADARWLETSSGSWSSGAAERARQQLERTLVQHAVPAVENLVVVARAGGEQRNGAAFEADLRRSDVRAGDRFVLTAISREPGFARGRIEGRRHPREASRAVVRFGRAPAYGGRLQFASGSLPGAVECTGIRLAVVPRTSYQVRFEVLRPVD